MYCELQYGTSILNEVKELMLLYFPYNLFNIFISIFTNNYYFFTKELIKNLNYDLLAPHWGELTSRDLLASNWLTLFQNCIMKEIYIDQFT